MVSVRGGHLRGESECVATRRRQPQRRRRDVHDPPETGLPDDHGHHQGRDGGREFDHQLGCLLRGARLRGQHMGQEADAPHREVVAHACQLALLAIHAYEQLRKRSRRGDGVGEGGAHGVERADLAVAAHDELRLARAVGGHPVQVDVATVLEHEEEVAAVPHRLS